MFSGRLVSREASRSFQLVHCVKTKGIAWTGFARHNSGPGNAITDTTESSSLEDKTDTPESFKDRVTALNEYKTYFPNDTSTNRLIDTYLAAGDKIKIGIVYENQKTAENSKLIESILADPLSSESRPWFESIGSRSRNNNVKFAFDTEPRTEVSSAYSSYNIPSPILSAVLRPLYANAIQADKSKFNDIELWELNRGNSSELCHYYVKVSNDSNITVTNDESAGQTALISIIDNQNYTPFSSESDPQSFDFSEHTKKVIKIDSARCYNGITQFYKYDVKAADSYLEQVKESNIHELVKHIVFYSQRDQLQEWLINIIKSRISADIVNKEELDQIIEAVNEKDILQFSVSSHSELQHSLIPEVRKYFKKRLQWWKLYFKNDNVEYDLKDFLHKKFMPSSIENFNFIRGKIVSKLQSQKSKDHKLANNAENPLLSLKADIIDRQITQDIQPYIYHLLTRALLIYQIPITIISFLSYQHFGYSLNSAVALAALGWVVGFNYISKNWHKFSNKWQNELFESTRLCLGKSCINNGLVKELEAKYQEQRKLADIRKKVIDRV